MNRVNNHMDLDTRSLEGWRRLINCYFEAETTEEEERQLRLFLASEKAAGVEFDEIKAVMGFLITGRTLRYQEKRKHFPFTATKWVVAAIVFLVAGTVTWYVADRRQNICVAYIYGEKCTNTREVMSQLKLSLCQVQHGEEDITVESQLNDIFQTLEDEDVTTVSNK